MLHLSFKKADFEVVEKFKKSNTYFDKLCNYYVEDIELFLKYMAKHHPSLDFSTLVMEAVEKEILAIILQLMWQLVM